MRTELKVLMLIAAAAAIAAAAFAVAEAEDSAAADNPIEPETRVYFVSEDGTYDTFVTDKATIRSSVMDAVKTQGGHSLEVKANGQIKSIDGKENEGDHAWVMFIWKSPVGWTPVTNTNSECHVGASIAVAFSEKVETSDGRSTYEAPDIDVEYTVHFFIRWDKWTEELNSNPWMRAIYDQIGWEKMKAGFWIYGNGFNNNDALAHAVYNEFFSQYACEIDTSAIDRVTWYVDGRQFFQYGIKSEMYGWFLDFLGWQDTKDSSAGGAYGTWTYWSQYRYDTSSGNLADADNWSFNQLSFGLYDISVDNVFGLWLRTTTEEPTGTIALGTPDAVRMDRTDSTDTSADGKTVTRNITVIDISGNKTGTKTDSVATADDGSRVQTVETLDLSGKRLSLEIGSFDSAGHLSSKTSTKYAYDASGNTVRTVETATAYIRDADGSVTSYTVSEKTTDADGNTSVTQSELRYAGTYELSISRSASGSSLSADVQSGSSAAEAIETLASMRAGDLEGASMMLIVHSKIAAEDMVKASDAGISLKIVGNEGNAVISGSSLSALSGAGDAEFSLARDLSLELLTADQYSTVGGDAQVFVITMKCGGLEQTSFGKIALTVNITGTPSGDLYVWRVDGDSLVELGPAEYDPITGRATFETDHLSVYAVGFRSPSSGDDGGFPTSAVAAIAIAVLAAAAVLVVRRRKAV